MEQSEGQIQISIMQSIAFKIKTLKFQVQNLKEIQSKFCAEYFVNLNEYLIQLLQLNNVITQPILQQKIEKNFPIILESRTFGSIEQDIWDILLFYKFRPDFLAQQIYNSKNLQIQQFVNFLLNDFYSSFINRHCQCEAFVSKYIFIQQYVQFFFDETRSFENVLNLSEKLNCIIHALIQNPMFFKFSQSIYNSLKKNESLNILMSQNFYYQSNQQIDVATQQTLNRTSSNSQKYGSIIQNSVTNKKDQSLLTSINVTDDEKNDYEEQNSLYSTACGELIKILQKCIKDFLPLDIKFFYHIIQKYCQQYKIDCDQIISLFFLQRFMISLLKKKQEYYQNNPFKFTRINFYAKIIQQFPQFCQIQQQDGSTPLKLIIQELCSFPDSLKEKINLKIENFKNQDITTQTFTEFNEKKTKTSKKITKIDSIKKTTSMLIKNKQITFNNFPNMQNNINDQFIYYQTPNNIKVDLQQKINDAISKTQAETFGSFSQLFSQSQLQDQPKNHQQSIFQNCSFHWEYMYVSHQLLEFFIDFYQDVQPTSNNLSKALQKLIQENLITVPKFQKDFQKQNIYILFSKDIKNIQLNQFIIPDNCYEQIFNLQKVSYSILNIFEGKSVHDFLQYYQNYYQFSYLENDQEKKNFINLYYKEELKNIIFVSKKQCINFDINNNRKIYQFFQALQDLQSKLDTYQQKLNEYEFLLNCKKDESFQIKECKDMLNIIIKNNIKQSLYKIFTQALDKTNLNLCLNTKKNTKQQQFVIDGYIIQNQKDCDYIMGKSFNFEHTSMDLLQTRNHIHFINTQNIQEFLRSQGLTQKLIEQGQFQELISFLITYQKQQAFYQLEKELDKNLLKNVESFLKQQNYIQKAFENFMEKIIYRDLFPVNYIKRDDGFRICCKVFDFVNLIDLYKFKNVDMIQSLIGPAIEKIREIQYKGGWQKKVENLKLSFMLLSSILELINHKKPGSEEIQPLLIYSILKAKPINMLSNFAFMKYLNKDKINKGEISFMLTHLEIGIKIIEQLSSENLMISYYDQSLLKQEVFYGIHSLKKRQYYRQVTVCVCQKKIFQFNQKVLKQISLIF